MPHQIHPSTIAPLCDWESLARGEGSCFGVDLAALLQLETDALLCAVRCSFPVNAVPGEVVAALMTAQSDLAAARRSIAALAEVVLTAYEAGALDASGRPVDPAAIAARKAEIEELATRAAELARASTHRPAHR